MRTRGSLSLLALVAATTALAAPASAQNKRWSLSAPPQEWVVTINPRTSFALNSDSGVTNLKLVNATLVEQSNKARIDPTQLRLCVAGDSACNRPITVGAGTVQRLELRTASGFPVGGSYTGDVYLAADGSTQQQSFKLSVLSTSWPARIGGGVAIAVGILLAWLLSTYLRNRALRQQALLQTARLREEVKRLRDRLGPIRQVSNHPLAGTTERLKELEASLDDEELEAQGYIPGSVASAFGTPVNAAGFQSFVAAGDGALAGLGVLITAMALIASQWATKPVAAATAIAALDGAAPMVADATSAASTAKSVIDTFNADNAQPRQAVAGAPPPLEPPSLHETRMHLQATHSWAWALWALLTLTVGITALIASNYGFGVGQDYFKCFFWGLGIQMAGQQLTPTTISTTYSLPKLAA